MKRVMTAVLLAFLVAACSKPTPVPSEPTAPPPPPPLVTIRVWTAFQDPLLDAMVTAFHEQQSGIRIERKVLAPLSQRWADELQTSIREDQVDVMAGYLAQIPVQTRLALELDPYVARSNFSLKAYGNGAEHLRREGRLYRLPYALKPNVIVYNPTLVEAAGVQPPRAGWTWEEFRSAAGTIAHGEGDGRVWGFASDTPQELANLMLADMEDPYDPESVEEVLRFLTTLIFADKSAPPGHPIPDGNQPYMFVPNDWFGKGRAGMTVSTFTFVGPLSLAEAGISPRAVAPAPVRQAGGTPRVTAPAELLVISSGTKQPDAAWEFVRFASGPEGALVAAKAGYLPAIMTEEAHKALVSKAAVGGLDQLLAVRWELAPIDRAPTVKAGAQGERDRLIRRVLSGQVSLENGMAEYRLAVEGK